MLQVSRQASVGIEGVVSNTTRSGHLSSVWILTLILWFNGASEGRERAIGMEKHKFAANSAATREPPIHPKYLNSGMVTASAPICRLQLTATGFAEIPQGVHLVD